MAETEIVLDKVQSLLRELYRKVVHYTYSKDESRQAQYDVAVLDMYEEIEKDFSYLDSVLLPSLSDATHSKQKIEYELHKNKERYRDIRTMHRTKKLSEKGKYLETTYIKSFDPTELNIDLKEDGIEHPEIDKGFTKYSAIDDNQLEELSAQEKLLEQNSLLTNKLQDVNALMKSTLLAGEINLSELEISTSSLSQLAESYAFFGDVLNRTNTLVKSINKASKSERVMIYRSLYFFISVCCWILWRRIFKRPVLLLLWLIISPIKLLVWSRSSSKQELISSSAATILSTTLVSLLESTASPEPTIDIPMLPETAITQTLSDIVKDYVKDEL